jgi:hypothetical protein
MQDPRMFYASDSPVFNGSDSDQEVYESAEETLGPEGQGDEQVGGNSVGLHVSFASSWLVSVGTNNNKAACATVCVTPVIPRATCTAHVTMPATFPATIASANVAFVATNPSTTALPRSA